MTLPEEVPAMLEQLMPYVAQVEEVQLLDFSTRAQYGPWAKFRMQEPGCLTGYKQGQRFHMILIAITEDDMPAAAEGKERKPYKLSQLAGMMCADEQFRHWITHAYGEPCHDKDAAAQFIREACGVESRSLLDVNDAAGEMFKGMLQDFDKWKQAAA